MVVVLTTSNTKKWVTGSSCILRGEHGLDTTRSTGKRQQLTNGGNFDSATIWAHAINLWRYKVDAAKGSWCRHSQTIYNHIYTGTRHGKARPPGPLYVRRAPYIFLMRCYNQNGYCLNYSSLNVQQSGTIAIVLLIDGLQLHTYRRTWAGYDANLQHRKATATDEWW